MFDNLIPGMFLNEKDEEDWNENQVEFIRKEEDITQASNNIKIVAKDLWERIFEEGIVAPDGELFMMKFMNYAAEVLTSNKDPRN
mmetsp:Transcript_15121/g.12841  ORF Transcript_15121/g.12841 Transcript_15121/m.12841 type:complete len:85 (+) Transcript_15121:1112-1366(+)